MPRRTPTPAEVVDREMEAVERLVRNLLVDNRNFKAGSDGGEAHQFRETPRTSEFVRGPLARLAGHILERLEASRGLVRDMAADPDVPGLTRSHSGSIHGYDVTLAEGGGGWRATLCVPDAFHDGDDLVADFEGEAEGIAALREFSLTGVVPDAFGPARSAPGPG